LLLEDRELAEVEEKNAVFFGAAKKGATGMMETRLEGRK
jgi:hypothetical protein